MAVLVIADHDDAHVRDTTHKTITAALKLSPEVDVLVAYVGPENAWYVIPIEALRGVTGVKLFPVARRRASKHEKYREAWGVMTAASRQPSAARS